MISQGALYLPLQYQNEYTDICHMFQPNNCQYKTLRHYSNVCVFHQIINSKSYVGLVKTFILKGADYHVSSIHFFCFTDLLVHFFYYYYFLELR